MLAEIFCQITFFKDKYRSNLKIYLVLWILSKSVDYLDNSADCPVTIHVVKNDLSFELK